jgi:hypothetical protein
MLSINIANKGGIALTTDELIYKSAVTPQQQALNTYLATSQIFSAYKYAKPRNSMLNGIPGLLFWLYSYCALRRSSRPSGAYAPDK